MRHWFRRSTMVLVATLAVALAACGDDVTDPDAVLASAEAEAVMRSASALPSLPGLAEGIDPATVQARTTLYRAQELWAAGAAADDARGLARRSLAARYAAPVLADALTAEEWDDVRARIDDWQATAEGMLRHIAMPAVDRRLRSARAQLERADRSVTAETRSYYLLLAASELVETTPRFVARVLTADAAEAVRRAEAARKAGPDAAVAVRSTAAPDGDGTNGPALAPPTEAALERAHRLKDWAARAVEREEYLLAIQRAYYAIQLAEGR